MIRVRVEMLVAGIDMGEDNELLGEMYIWNNLETTIKTKGKRGSYGAEIFKRRGHLYHTLTHHDFPRTRHHAWELVRRILNQAAQEKGHSI